MPRTRHFPDFDLPNDKYDLAFSTIFLVQKQKRTWNASVHKEMCSFLGPGHGKAIIPFTTKNRLQRWWAATHLRRTAQGHAQHLSALFAAGTTEKRWTLRDSNGQNKTVRRSPVLFFGGYRFIVVTLQPESSVSDNRKFNIKKVYNDDAIESKSDLPEE